MKIASFLFTFFFLLTTSVFSQQTATEKPLPKIMFSGDFKFRGEQDWNSRKPDGTYREDRFRLRYRLRVGFVRRIEKKFELSAGIRTGSAENEQDSYVTIGGKTHKSEFIKIGIERAYLKYKKNNFQIWVGKDKYPFWKQNELLWSDGVFPEGIALGYQEQEGRTISIAPFFGHFILKSSGQHFNFDSYLSSAQLKIVSNFRKSQRVIFNIGNLYFNNIAKMPNDYSGETKNYNIITSSLQYSINKWKKKIVIGGDFLINTVNYQIPENLPANMSTQKTGFIFNFKLGESVSKHDFIFHFYYADIGAYAVVNYLAQNDYGRWDYNLEDALLGRLSNFRGFEIRVGYNITDKVNIFARYFRINQKVSVGSFKENGSRFRVDIGSKF